MLAWIVTAALAQGALCPGSCSGSCTVDPSPVNVDALRAAFEWYSGNNSACYEPIGDWDVSSITNFVAAFYYDYSSNPSNATIKGYYTSFNESLENWEVGQATQMNAMFWGASSFNQNLSNWNTGNVINMAQMFHTATNFTGVGVSEWKTGNVEHMNAMFIDATSFDQNLSKWDTGKVENMRTMFYSASAFTGKGVFDWNVSSVENMEHMFNGATHFNADLSNWDTKNVENME